MAGGRENQREENERATRERRGAAHAPPKPEPQALEAANPDQGSKLKGALKTVTNKLDNLTVSESTARSFIHNNNDGNFFTANLVKALEWVDFFKSMSNKGNSNSEKLDTQEGQLNPHEQEQTDKDLSENLSNANDSDAPNTQQLEAAVEGIRPEPGGGSVAEEEEEETLGSQDQDTQDQDAGASSSSTNIPEST